jgi:hypothetical protein
MNVPRSTAAISSGMKDTDPAATLVDAPVERSPRAPSEEEPAPRGLGEYRVERLLAHGGYDPCGRSTGFGLARAC